MNFKKFIAIFFLVPLFAFAQQSQNIPSIDEIVGDYVIINYKDYNDATYVSEVKNFSIALAAAESEEQADSLLISNFYMKGSLSFKAAYNAANGNITIPAGTKVFGYSDGVGTVQTLYSWDETNSEITTRPIVYRLQSDGTWVCNSYIVLQSGEAGTTSYTYYDFSQKSRLAPANSTTSNITYDGDQVKFVESRPSFVEIKDNYITVYNLLQKDSYGYGCWITFFMDSSNNTVLSAPTMIGSVSSDFDYPYKALTGCEYDEENCRPKAISYAETQQEGYIIGTYDFSKGTITLPPMAVWPATYDDEGVCNVDLTRYYEVEESVTVTFDVQSAILANISQTLATNKNQQIKTIEYFNLMGKRLMTTTNEHFVIKRTTYSDGTSLSEKIINKK